MVEDDDNDAVVGESQSLTYLERIEKHLDTLLTYDKNFEIGHMLFHLRQYNQAPYTKSPLPWTKERFEKHANKCTTGYQLYEIIQAAPSFWTQEQLKKYKHKIKRVHTLGLIIKCNPEIWTREEIVEVLNNCKEADTYISDIADTINAKPEFADAVLDGFIKMKGGVQNLTRNEIIDLIFRSEEAIEYFMQRGGLQESFSLSTCVEYLMKCPSERSAIFLIRESKLLESHVSSVSSQKDKDEAALALRDELITALGKQTRSDDFVSFDDQCMRINLLLGHLYSNKLIGIDQVPSADDLKKAILNYEDFKKDHFLYPEAQLALAELYLLYYVGADRTTLVREHATRALQAPQSSEKTKSQAERLIRMVNTTDRKWTENQMKKYYKNDGTSTFWAPKGTKEYPVYADRQQTKHSAVRRVASVSRSQ